MLLEKLITFIIWIWQNLILKYWPVDFPWQRLSDFQIQLDQMRDFLIASFGSVGSFFPVLVFLGLLIVILTSEIFLLGLKIINRVINIFRGSGS
jgi:hypothetical protein